jgi:DNA-binding GntR family transcriptional regulator
MRIKYSRDLGTRANWEHEDLATLRESRIVSTPAEITYTVILRDASKVLSVWHTYCVISLLPVKGETESVAPARLQSPPNTLRLFMTSVSRADVAYLSLRQAIVEQALVPGMKLREDVLATHFAVSRTLIRAALARLANEGLIDTGNKRTATVARPSREEAKAVFDVRRCLEAEVTRLLIKNWQPSYTTVLEEHVLKEEESDRAGNPKLSLRVASDFHLLLAQLAGNALLERYVSEVVSRCSLILAVYGHEQSQECGIREHHELIAALRKRDVVRAQHLMEHHLQSLEERALAPRPDASGSDITEILGRYSASFSPAVKQEPSLEGGGHRFTRGTTKHTHGK